ncbi:MAG: hypothetical protein FWB72_05835 [Firmicutes bacterium]|nr:hypothetical protein [Bacillota bacterium]
MRIDVMLENESVVDIIKDWKLAEMFSKDAEGEFLLFKKEGLDFKMHDVLFGYLSETDRMNEIMEFLANKTEITRIVIFDDTGDKIGFRLRKPECFR